MSRSHYGDAEEYLAKARQSRKILNDAALQDDINRGTLDYAAMMMNSFLAEAQVHATLALADETARSR